MPVLDPSEPTFRLLVGLGNPGREYQETRHNVGFMVLDQIAAKAGATWRIEKAWKGEIARCDDTLLLKPLTYMNLSGQSAKAVAAFHKIQPTQMLIILDDMALPLGKLRLRPEGSAGGHNGLQSIVEHLGTRSIPRLRIGIGESGGAERTTGHVLGKFRSDERPAIADALIRAVDAINLAQTRGLTAAMNTFN